MINLIDWTKADRPERVEWPLSVFAALRTIENNPLTIEGMNWSINSTYGAGREIIASIGEPIHSIEYLSFYIWKM